MAARMAAMWLSSGRRLLKGNDGLRGKLDAGFGALVAGVGGFVYIKTLANCRFDYHDRSIEIDCIGSMKK